jgi:hypothetical protein
MVLAYLIKSGEHVRFLDGFVGKTDLDVLKGLGIRNVVIVRMLPKYTP